MEIATTKKTIKKRSVNLTPLIQKLFPKVGHTLSCEQLLWQLAGEVYGITARSTPDFSYFRCPKELAEIGQILTDLMQEGNKGFRLMLCFEYNYEDWHKAFLKRTR